MTPPNRYRKIAGEYSPGCVRPGCAHALAANLTQQAIVPPRPRRDARHL